MSKQINNKSSKDNEIPSDWQALELGDFAETEKGKYVPVVDDD